MTMRMVVHHLPGPGVEVDAVAAVRWMGDNWAEVQRVLLGHPKYSPTRGMVQLITDHPHGVCLSVDTQLGTTPCADNAWPGDTIVLDALGRFWIDRPRREGGT